MNTWTRVLFTLFISSKCVTQNDAFVVFSTGILTSPYHQLNPGVYQNVKPNIYYNFGLAINILNKSTFEFNILKSNLRYFDNLFHTNIPKGDVPVDYIRSDGTNSDIENLISSLSINLNLYNSKICLFRMGTGIGLIAMIYKFQYKQISGLNSLVFQNRTSSFTSVVFPIQMQIDFKIHERIMLRIEAGGYIEPDYPVIALHSGLGIKYRIH